MSPAWNGISRRSVSLFPRVRQSCVRSAGSADWAGSAGLRIKKRPPLAVFRTRLVAISQGLRSVSLFPRVRQFRVRTAGSADWAGSAGFSSPFLLPLSLSPSPAQQQDSAAARQRSGAAAQQRQPKSAPASETAKQLNNGSNRQSRSSREQQSNTADSTAQKRQSSRSSRSSREAGQQSGRAADQQSGRPAEQQSSRAAEQQSQAQDSARAPATPLTSRAPQLFWLELAAKRAWVLRPSRGAGAMALSLSPSFSLGLQSLTAGSADVKRAVAGRITGGSADVKRTWSADVKRRSADVKMHRSADVKMHRSADVKMHPRSADVKRIRSADVKRIRSADVKRTIRSADVKRKSELRTSGTLKDEIPADIGNLRFDVVSCKDVMHDPDFCGCSCSSRRPYRWWKARAVIAANARWGKRRELWQGRLGSCTQDEAWWRSEDARHAVRMEEAEVLAVKKLECRRLARERRKLRVAATRAKEMQAEEARRSSARASHLDFMAAFCAAAWQASELGEPAQAICNEASSVTPAKHSGYRLGRVAQKQLLDMFFHRRCARADIPFVGRRRSRCSLLSSHVLTKGTADVRWLRFFAFMQFACLPLLDATPCENSSAGMDENVGQRAWILAAQISLRAREVGGVRLRQHRRRGRCLFSAVSASVEIDPRAFAVVDAGSQVGKWRSKCLQASILSLCADSSLRRVLHTRFTRQCNNHVGSGVTPAFVERRNLYAVQQALCQMGERVHVIVMSSSGLGAASSGHAMWQLGCPNGDALGVVLWSVEGAHVLACYGMRFKDVTPDRSIKWPWPGSVVCGPKKSPEQFSAS